MATEARDASVAAKEVSGGPGRGNTVSSWLWWIVSPWIRLFTCIPGDLWSLKWYEATFLAIFGAICVVFSFLDVNENSPSKDKVKNLQEAGGTYTDRVLLSLSGAAAFTGAVCVVFASKGRYANYSFGIINCTLYGLFAWSYGYAGDAQMNLIFFNVMQFIGMYMWTANTSMDPTQTARVRILNWWQWIIALAASAGFSAAFYWEIPAFAEYIKGPDTYFYPGVTTPHMLDSVSNALNIVGQCLLMGRFREQWPFWLCVNCMQIAMFSGINGYPADPNSLIMWSFFLANSSYGAYSWIIRYNTQVKEDKKRALMADLENYHAGARPDDEQAATVVELTKTKSSAPPSGTDDASSPAGAAASSQGAAASASGESEEAKSLMDTPVVVELKPEETISDALARAAQEVKASDAHAQAAAATTAAAPAPAADTAAHAATSTDQHAAQAAVVSSEKAVAATTAAVAAASSGVAESKDD